MIYFAVNREWLFSRTSQRVYLLCAVLDLALVATVIGVVAAMSVAGVFFLPAVARITLQSLLLLEAIGTAVLTVGMTYCWLTIGGSCGRKLVWLFCLNFFLITMPIYYFSVYRRMASSELVELRSTGQTGATFPT